MDIGRFAKWFVVVACTSALAGCLSWHSGPMSGEPRGAQFTEIDGVRVRYQDTRHQDTRHHDTRKHDTRKHETGKHDAGAAVTATATAPRGGSVPAVVMLHGFASSLDTWRPVTQMLGKGFRVVSLDLKGFGWSDRPAGDYSPTAQAKLVAALLDKLEIKRFAVVAHSWGSAVGLALALQHPDRVTRLALYDAWALDEQLPPFFRWAQTPGLGELLLALYYDQHPVDRMTHAFYDPAVIPQALADAVTRALKRPGTKRAALAAIRSQNLAAQQQHYKDVTAPVLLLWGAQDHVAALHHGRKLQSLLPHAQLRVYQQCGHFPMIEAATASGSDLRRFLAQDRAVIR